MKNKSNKDFEEYENFKFTSNKKAERKSNRELLANWRENEDEDCMYNNQEKFKQKRKQSY